jgi:UDP-4-amino-4,6-dideoxy-N-acetyl-beta-L-altrosamine N-acetyltransferase
MTAADLHTVLAWRNDPQVRLHMFTRDEIALADHVAWFERSSHDPLRHLLVFESDGVPLGFVSLVVASAAGRVADWGFYAAPGAPKGTGRHLGATTLEHAFGPLALHKVCGQVLGENVRSIHFHEALGFRQEGLLRQQHFDGTHHHDVACFGLLRHEWSVKSVESTPC